MFDFKEDIERYVQKYNEIRIFEKKAEETQKEAIELVASTLADTDDEIDAVKLKLKKEIPDRVREKVAEKFGLQTRGRVFAKLAELVDYHDVYEKCSIHNNIDNYLGLPGAEYID